LTRQRDGRKRFARALVAVAADQKKAPILRDYSMQHLRTLWKFSRSDSPLQDSIEQFFHSLADDEQLSSSALLSLHLLCDDAIISTGQNQSVRENQINRHIEDRELIPILQRSLQREGMPERALTAIKIIKERQLSEFLPELRAASSRENGEHVMIQMAAIAALSKFQLPEDKQLIESLESEDLRIIRAKTHALSAFSRTQS